jgi:membrane-bound lytic murein transglycosylase B
MRRDHAGHRNLSTNRRLDMGNPTLAAPVVNHQPQNAGLATSAKLAALDLEAAEVGRRVSSIYATANAAGISMRWLESLLARLTYAVPTRLKQRRGNATTVPWLLAALSPRHHSRRQQRSRANPRNAAQKLARAF